MFWSAPGSCATVYIKLMSNTTEQFAVHTVQSRAGAIRGQVLHALVELVDRVSVTIPLGVVGLIRGVVINIQKDVTFCHVGDSRPASNRSVSRGVVQIV